MAGAVVAAVLAPSGCATRPAEARPNVLLVTLDTTRLDRLGCYGGRKELTPNLDALAADGVRFDAAYSASGSTPQSHASILTGLYPFQHGLRVIYAPSGYRLPEAVPTLATVLGERGWRTAAFLSAFTVSEFFGFQRGFDLWDNGLKAPVGSILVQPRKDGPWLWALAPNQRRSDDTADRVLDWLGNERGPFFAWVHFFDPHDAYLRPPEEVLRQFPPDGPGPLASMRALYDAEVHFVDIQLGRILDALKTAGRYEDTMIVVVADHGEGLGDHGWPGHQLLYQEQIHVPLVVRLPGEPRGKTVAAVVRTIDIFPTVLEGLGIDRPGRSSARSLRRLIRGEPDEPRIAYAEQLNEFDLNADVLRARPLDGRLYCVTDGVLKLIDRRSFRERSELFRLSDDPGELRNLLPDARSDASRLLGLLDAMHPYRDRPFGEGEGDREALERLRSLGYVGRPVP